MIVAMTRRASVAGCAAIAAVRCVLVAATAVRAEFAENFDGVAAPALPGFWTTASFGLSWATLPGPRPLPTTASVRSL